MKHIRLGELDVSRIGLGAMGMSFACSGAAAGEQQMTTIDR